MKYKLIIEPGDHWEVVYEDGSQVPELETAKRAVACMNACDDMKQPEWEVDRLRRQLDATVRAFNATQRALRVATSKKGYQTRANFIDDAMNLTFETLAEHLITRDAALDEIAAIGKETPPC